MITPMGRLWLFLRDPHPPIEAITTLIRNPRVRLEHFNERVTGTGYLEVEFSLRLESMESLEEILAVATGISGVLAVRSDVPRRIRRRIA